MTNYMEQVAQMLGVELDEEFKVKIYDSYIFKITKDGLYWKCNDGWERVILTIMDDILCGRIEIKKPILDKAEKEYLSSIIKPFRKQVFSIVKLDNRNYEDIVIKYHNINGYTGTICFPAFEKGTMYKGMELEKRYSLEDLGL